MIDSHPVIFTFIMHSAPIDNIFIIKDNVYDVTLVNTSRMAMVQPEHGMNEWRIYDRTYSKTVCKRL